MLGGTVVFSITYGGYRVLPHLHTCINRSCIPYSANIIDEEEGVLNLGMSYITLYSV